MKKNFETHTLQQSSSEHEVCHAKDVVLLILPLKIVGEESLLFSDLICGASSALETSSLASEMPAWPCL